MVMRNLDNNDYDDKVDNDNDGDDNDTDEDDDEMLMEVMVKMRC